MTFEIRVLTPADTPVVADLFRAIAADADARHFQPHPMTADAALAICENPGRDVFVAAFVGASPVGYGMLRGWNEGYAIPSLGIYVAAAQRGHGLATRLMQALHRLAIERGATTIRLRVAPDNTRAVALYRRLGYRFADQERGQLVGLLDLHTSDTDRPHTDPIQGTER